MRLEYLNFENGDKNMIKLEKLSKEYFKQIMELKQNFHKCTDGNLC